MTVRIQFQLRDEVAERLEEQAAERGISRQAYVQDLIMAGAGSQWEEVTRKVLSEAPVGRGVQGLARRLADESLPGKVSELITEADRNALRAAERLGPQIEEHTREQTEHNAKTAHELADAVERDAAEQLRRPAGPYTREEQVKK